MKDGLVEEIKDRVSCNDFVRHIGLSVNRAGYCCCPFHNERTASLKIYDNGKGWYCFGCHSGGDVINLASKYYGTGFIDTIQQLASDFGIQTNDAAKDDSAALLRAVKAAKNKSIRDIEKRKIEAIEAEYWVLFDSWLDNERIVMNNAPKNPDDEFDEKFVYAVIRRESLVYQLENAEIRRNRKYGGE